MLRGTLYRKERGQGRTCLQVRGTVGLRDRCGKARVGSRGYLWHLCGLGERDRKGGAFSGKDPTKVDRSAAYAARYVAKNIVAASIAKKCEIQLAYAIGVAQPVSVMVDTFGTGVVSDDKIAEAVKKIFDLRPSAIIDALDLRRPIYRKTAAYGHMGRTDIDLSWEKTDKTEQLKNLLLG